MGLAFFVIRMNGSASWTFSHLMLYLLSGEVHTPDGRYREGGNAAQKCKGQDHRENSLFHNVLLCRLYFIKTYSFSIGLKRSDCQGISW